MSSYYVTKYALTMGVMVLDGARCVEKERMLCYTPSKGASTQYYHGEGRDWHRTIPLAEKRVEAMKASRRKSLEKSIKKLAEPIDYIAV